MSQTPSELPPPPPGQTSGEVPPPPSASAVPPPPSPTQIAGQQTAPSSTVPHTPGLVPQSGGKTNTLAVVSIIAAFGSFFAHIIPGVGGFTVALVAVITGFIARGQIKKTGEQGGNLATIGIVVGLIHIALLALLVVVVIIAIFVFGIAMFGYSRSSSG